MRTQRGRGPVARAIVLEMAKKPTQPRSALRVEPALHASPASRAAGARVQRKHLDVDAYVAGVLAGDRAILGRCITLVESSNPEHQQVAQRVLDALMPSTGAALRVGITGVPGVGKSTFIETLGCNLTAEGRRVAVLAVDPSSGRTGGSILGDKTRMNRLAGDANAFIRPSPSAGTLGGVASKTRETLLICEAGGFDVVLVETVGVGQSEFVVADMTDFFVALMLPGAGDELQGIKRGILEVADLLAVNKADGDNNAAAKRAAHEYENALRYMHPREADWCTAVVTCSAVENRGVAELWTRVVERLDVLRADGRLEARRREQMLRWMWSMIDERLRGALRGHAAVRALLPGVEEAVRTGRSAPTRAADEVLSAFGVLGGPDDNSKNKRV